MSQFREKMINMTDEERAQYIYKLVSEKDADLAVPPSVYIFLMDQIKELQIVEPMQLMSDPDSIVANFLASSYLDEDGIVFLMELVQGNLRADTANIGKAVKKAMFN